MYIDDGEELKNFYNSHDSWLYDIDYFMKEEYIFSVKKSPTTLLERVSAHLIYWLNDFMNEEENAEDVIEKIQENDILSRLSDIDDMISPELIIYDFDGTSVYDDITGDTMTINESEGLIEFDLGYKGTLCMTKEEFEDHGGSIDIFKPDEDEDDVEIDFYFPSGTVYFFMSDENLEKMSEYLLASVEELNKIYKSLGLKTIEIV